MTATPVRFTDHDGTVNVGTLRRHSAIGAGWVDVWHEGRMRSFRAEQVRLLCGGCTTRHDRRQRVPRTCRTCDRLDVGDLTAGAIIKGNEGSG